MIYARLTATRLEAEKEPRVVEFDFVSARSCRTFVFGLGQPSAFSRQREPALMMRRFEESPAER